MSNANCSILPASIPSLYCKILGSYTNSPITNEQEIKDYIEYAKNYVETKFKNANIYVEQLTSILERMCFLVAKIYNIPFKSVNFTPLNTIHFIYSLDKNEVDEFLFNQIHNLLYENTFISKSISKYGIELLIKSNCQTDIMLWLLLNKVFKELGYLKDISLNMYFFEIFSSFFPKTVKLVESTIAENYNFC